MTKSGPATVIAGNQITYTIVVSNAGPSDAQSVSLADVLDGNLTGAQYKIGAGSFSPYTSPVALGTIAAGGSATVTIQATVNPSTASGTDIANQASASSPTDAGSPRASNTVHTTVQTNAVLSVTKSDGVSTVTAGTSTTYTIVVSNAGPSDAQSVVLTDTLPAANTSNAKVCVVTMIVTCASAGDFTATRATTRSRSAPSPRAVRARSRSASTSTPTLRLARRSPTRRLPRARPMPARRGPGPTRTRSRPTPILSVTKSGPATVIAGNQITYTIVVSNAGPSDAQSSQPGRCPRRQPDRRPVQDWRGLVQPVHQPGRPRHDRRRRLGDGDDPGDGQPARPRAAPTSPTRPRPARRPTPAARAPATPSTRPFRPTPSSRSPRMTVSVPSPPGPRRPTRSSSATPARPTPSQSS